MKNDKKREIRTLECHLSIREAEGDQTSESRTIQGTAIVFDAESEVLDDWGQRFREVIRPSAATMEFLNSQDIKMNLLHERELTIARCNKGEGSLRLNVDEKGVHFEFESPKCDIGDRALALVRAGVYSGCSFEFRPGDYDIQENGDEVKITHNRFDKIFALTLGMDPAYSQTNVNAREAFDNTPTGKALIAKREAEREEREKAERDAIAKEMERRERMMKIIELEGEDF